MKVNYYGEQLVEVELSRRNIENLLAALDRGDHALLTRYDKSADALLKVRVVEDSQHYREREPGPMPLDEPLAEWEKELLGAAKAEAMPETSADYIAWAIADPIN